MELHARVSRALFALVALAAMGDECEATAQMTPVGAPFAVSSDLTSTPIPAVAMNANGDFVVVWSIDAPGGAADFDVFARRFDRTGTPFGTAEFTVNTITSGNQTDPSVAFIGDGSNFVVVWTGTDANYAGIRGNVFDDTNTPQLGQDAVFNDEEVGDERRPAVAGTDTGFVVTWEHAPIGADSEIRSRVFASNGTAGPDGTVVTASSVSLADVDAADDGSFVVTWVQGVALQNTDIFARRFDDTGTAAGTAFIVNSFTTERQTRPHVQVGGAGDFVVAWDLGTSYVPSFQRFDSTGTKLGGETAAAERDAPSPNPSFIDLALVADGSFATTYVGPSAVAPIRGLLFDDTGSVIDSDPSNPIHAEFLVHDSTDSGNKETTATYPAIATDGCGLYVVAYGNNGAFSQGVAPHAAARLFTSGPTCAANPSCGDADGNGSTTASDALFTLRAAVGSATCALCVCDVNGDGHVTASDALLVLRAAVGTIVSFSCPACP